MSESTPEPKLEVVDVVWGNGWAETWTYPKPRPTPIYVLGVIPGRACGTNPTP